MNKYDHLSYSSISKFIACPAQFDFYMNGKKALPSETALAGKNRHEEISKHLILGSMDFSKFGDRMKGFCRHVLKTPNAVEHEFVLDFITNKIIGSIDAYAVHGTQAVIVDWKNYPGYNDELQLKIYAMAVKERHPEVELIHAYFFFTGPDYYEPYTYFPEDLNRFSHELAQTIDVISTTEKFEPRPGPHCSRCSYVESCSVAKNFDIIKIETAQDISELVRKTYAVESLLDKAREKIKMWLVEHGLESIPSGPDGRYYLSSSTALRQGKFKTDKDREACVKAYELVVAELPRDISKVSDAQPGIESPALTTNDQTEATIRREQSNIVTFQPKSGALFERIKMSEIAELMKRAGLMKEDASPATASNKIRDKLGMHFTMATDEQKTKLKAELEELIARKSA